MLRSGTQRFVYKCISILRNLNVSSTFQDMKAEVLIAKTNHEHFSAGFLVYIYLSSELTFWPLPFYTISPDVKGNVICIAVGWNPLHAKQLQFGTELEIEDLCIHWPKQILEGHRN